MVIGICLFFVHVGMMDVLHHLGPTYKDSPLN